MTLTITSATVAETTSFGTLMLVTNASSGAARTLSVILSENSGDATLGSSTATIKISNVLNSSSSTLISVDRNDPVLDTSGCTRTGLSFEVMLLTLVGLLLVRRFRFSRGENQ